MATHSSILAWEIPWSEEPGGLQSMVVRRVSLAHARVCVRISFIFEAVNNGPRLSITVCPLRDGHFSDFHLLASMNLDPQSPTFNSWDIYPEVELLVMG